MRKNILVINGNPDKDSFSTELARAYEKGALKGAANVNVLHLHDLEFDPILHNGFKEKMPLEPDLIKAQSLIKQANHLVFVYPVWWGTYPALLKGFIDRTFLPGFAFKGNGKSVYWDKLLTGKTAHIIETFDAPVWFYEDVYKSPAKNSLSVAVLNFCGIKPVEYSAFTPIKGSTSKERDKWLNMVNELGQALK